MYPCNQGLSGIAKDLVKTSGKAVTKLVDPSSKQSSLFKVIHAKYV